MYPIVAKTTNCHRKLCDLPSVLASRKLDNFSSSNSSEKNMPKCAQVALLNHHPNQKIQKPQYTIKICEINDLSLWIEKAIKIEPKKQKKLII